MVKPRRTVSMLCDCSLWIGVMAYLVGGTA